jgi:hypothetical protein
MPVVLTAYALIGGLLSLAGWVADVQRLTDWEASGLSIQPNAALALMAHAYPQQGGGVTVYFQDITEIELAAQESAADLDAMARLQTLSVRLVQSGERDALPREILSAAADLTRTDKGNIQFYDPASKRLRIAAAAGKPRADRMDGAALPCRV